MIQDQTKMMWLGVKDDSTPMHFIVDDYFTKKFLGKMGFSFDGSKLSDFEIEAYNVISAEAANLEKADMIRDRLTNKG